MCNSHKCSSDDLLRSYANCEWTEEIRTLKKRLRLSMDGVVSSSLRDRGMSDYRIIFGCSMQSLKRIAAETPHEIRLADYLWQENIRESKILATMIHPVGAFDLDKAHRWSLQTPYTEIAEQLAMNLICHTPFALSFAIDQLHDHDQKAQTVALLTLHRAAIVRKEWLCESKPRLIDSLLTANLLNENSPIASRCLNLWKGLLRVSPETNDAMLKTIELNTTIEAQQKSALLAALRLEMEYI